MAAAFGAEPSFEEAKLVLIPVPWEATASYGGGAGLGPELVRQASFQLDFFCPARGARFNHLIYFQDPDPEIISLNREASSLAEKIKSQWTEDKKTLSAAEKQTAEKARRACRAMIQRVKSAAADALSRGKIPALLGGDHSVSEGLLELFGERLKGRYGILHLDAHADLRTAYQGFQHSHASVMNNVLSQAFAPEKLLQAGVRDLCEEEHERIQKDPRIVCYFDEALAARLFAGEAWGRICQEMAAHLPPAVYVSVDMDAFSWEYAPGTGTPVPGGLSFNQALFLFQELKRQKKQIIGFDVTEISGGGGTEAPPSGAVRRLREWNGNVAARLAYRLAGLALP